jgi:hypothetical protein
MTIPIRLGTEGPQSAINFRKVNQETQRVGRSRPRISTAPAAFLQLTNKAVSGDIEALREVIRLREKLQEKEPYLNNGPNFIVNFIDPKTKRPVGEKT